MYLTCLHSGEVEVTIVESSDESKDEGVTRALRPISRSDR